MTLPLIMVVLLLASPLAVAWGTAGYVPAPTAVGASSADASTAHGPAGSIPAALAQAIGAQGFVENHNGGCAGDDLLPFAATDNGDGTWTFVFAQLGHPDCPWAMGDVIIADGSPDAGFSAGAAFSSSRWHVDGDGSFTARFTVKLLIQTALANRPVEGMLVAA